MANGAFLGGFAEGQQAGFRERLNRQALELQERQLRRQEDLDLRQRAEKSFQEHSLALKDALDGVAIAKEEGDLDLARQFAQDVEKMKQNLLFLAPTTGRDPDFVNSLVLRAENQALLSKGAAKQKATAEAEGKLAGAEAITGEELTAGQKQKLAGVSGPAPKFVNVFLPNEPEGKRVRIVDINDPDAMNEVRRKGGQIFSSAVESASVGGLSSVSQISDKELSDLRDNINTTNNALEKIESARQRLRETPEAAGIQGILIENVGGILEQIPGMRNFLRSAGFDTPEVSAARSELRQLTASLLRDIVQDERFTKDEREIGNQALKTLTPNSSTEIIDAALGTTEKLFQRNQSSQLQRLMGQANIKPQDLATPDGMNKFADFLVQKQGFTPENAIRSISQLRQRLGLSGGIQERDQDGR